MTPVVLLVPSTAAMQTSYCIYYQYTNTAAPREGRHKIFNEVVAKRQRPVRKQSTQVTAVVLFFNSRTSYFVMYEALNTATCHKTRELLSLLRRQLLLLAGRTLIFTHF